MWQGEGAACGWSCCVCWVWSTCSCWGHGDCWLLFPWIAVLNLSAVYEMHSHRISCQHHYFINCFPQRKDLVWEVPSVWGDICQCRTTADKQAVLWGEGFPRQQFFSGFLVKVFCLWVFGLIFIMEKPLTHVRVQIPRGSSKRFVLGRLKRLQTQSSFPEETARGFLDLLKYVWLISWL